MNKYIHNKSGTAKYYLGEEILDGTFFLIPPLRELKYMENEGLLNDITAGTVCMSIDGITDLSISASQTFLAYRAEALEQRFRDNGERANLFQAKNVQDAIEEARDETIGSIYQLSFVKKGSFDNKWMANTDTNISSDEVMGLIPWKSKLIGITFVNKKENVDVGLKIWHTDVLDNHLPKTLAFEWGLTGVRLARKTNFNTDITFDAGDKIGVFAEDRGGEPKDGVFIMYLKVIENTWEEAQQNFKDDTSSDGGGIS